MHSCMGIYLRRYMHNNMLALFPLRTPIMFASWTNPSMAWNKHLAHGSWHSLPFFQRLVSGVLYPIHHFLCFIKDLLKLFSSYMLMTSFSLLIPPPCCTTSSPSFDKSLLWLTSTHYSNFLAYLSHAILRFCFFLKNSMPLSSLIMPTWHIAILVSLLSPPMLSLLANPWPIQQSIIA
jgi:hypothetical protein